MMFVISLINKQALCAQWLYQTIAVVFPHQARRDPYVLKMVSID